MPSKLRPRAVRRVGQVNGRWLDSVSHGIVQSVQTVGVPFARNSNAIQINPTVEKRRGYALEVLKITGATQDGSNKRWAYTGTRQYKSAAGFAGWADHPTDTYGYTLYSLNESANGASGTYGNGVTETDLDNINDPDGTVDLQPIPTGTHVACVFVRVPGQVEPEYWILNLPNGVTGACPS